MWTVVGRRNPLRPVPGNVQPVRPVHGVVSTPNTQRVPESGTAKREISPSGMVFLHREIERGDVSVDHPQEEVGGLVTILIVTSVEYRVIRGHEPRVPVP
jgi:hypothetical protein